MKLFISYSSSALFAIFGCGTLKVNCDEMTGDRPRQRANGNC